LLRSYESCQQQSLHGCIVPQLACRDSRKILWGPGLKSEPNGGDALIVRVRREGVADDAPPVVVPRQVVHEQRAIDDLEAEPAVLIRDVAVVAVLVL